MHHVLNRSGSACATAVLGRPSARPANHRAARCRSSPALVWAARPAAVSAPSVVLATALLCAGSKALLGLKQHRSAEHGQPVLGTSGQRRCGLLVLRSSAAPRHWGRAGASFARSASARMVWLRKGAAFVARHGRLGQTRVPNPSVNRTSNIKLRLLSAAGYLERWASRGG